MYTGESRLDSGAHEDKTISANKDHEMSQTTSGRDLNGYLEPGKVDRLIAVATSLRDKAFIAVLSKSGVGISEAIQIKESDIDFEQGTLTIVHLKKKLILKCPNCRELLGKRYIFCSVCGEKVSQTIPEEIEHLRERIISLDPVTLRLIKKYLRWRRQFSYRGPLLFPFTRQRGWQLVERVGRRARISGLNPNSLRHLLIATRTSIENEEKESKD
jgi:integrase/recombinase XerD